MFRFVILLLTVITGVISAYDPETDNIYYLYTRNNPTVSQILVNGNASQVMETNFNATKKIAVTIHGWTNSVTSKVNLVLVPALLSAEDVNVIVVDWSAGADTIDYPTALDNAIRSGPAVAKFLTWLNNVTGADLSQYHIVGHSLGGQQSGIVGRNLGGLVPYITALDPAGPGFLENDNRFKPTDGIYTEVIHTNGGEQGYIQPLGQTDFYVNGGATQSGCNLISTCDHGRSFLYFAESLTSGGFTATNCSSYEVAIVASCSTLGKTSGTLKMGGINPKTGSRGVYYLKTNSDSPYSIS